jgi:hypothetical protein
MGSNPLAEYQHRTCFRCGLPAYANNFMSKEEGLLFIIQNAATMSL